MDKFIPPEKRSKKEQKKLNAKRRRTWGEMSPVTRTVPNGKAYNRKKLKNDERRNSRYFREEGTAVLLFGERIPERDIPLAYFTAACYTEAVQNLKESEVRTMTAMKTESINAFGTVTSVSAF